jgi:hypothetical protein
MERICRGCLKPVGDEPWFQAKHYWHLDCHDKTRPIAFSGFLRAAEQHVSADHMELEPK